MILYDLMFVLISMLFMAFVYFTWNDNYWLKREIPYIQAKLFFGNIKDVVFMKRTIGQVYEEIYKKLGDKPLGGFFKLRQPILMVKHPHVIKQVFVDKFDCFCSNDINVRRDTSPILKMNPILASGATWRSTKAVLSPLSKPTTLDGMLEIVKNISKDMVEFIECKKNFPIETKDLASKYVSDVIAVCALGQGTNNFKSTDNTFKEMSEKILQTNVKSNIALLFALYAPDLANCFHYRIIPRRISKYFISLVTETCKFRVRESVEKKDFLQHLININKESEASGEGTVYNYDKIAGHCMTIFIDGYLMTSNPLYYCLYEIASDEKIQKKLKGEINSKGITKIDDLCQDNIKDLIYLDMVLSETLRLHPSVQAITRLCTKDTILQFEGLNYAVETGTPVAIPVYALHMDPKHYNDPGTFLPERFAEEARDKFTYLPFGMGPRECPGSTFAKLILKIAIVSVLLHYDVTTDLPRRGLAQDPRSSILNAAEGDVPLKFTKVPS